MEFGIALKLLHDAKAEARMAEDLGFDYLSTGEHISFHIATSNNIVALAAAAGATERIKPVPYTHMTLPTKRIV